MKTRLVYNDKCKKSHTKANQNQTKSSAQLTWIIFERNVVNVGPPPKPNLFLQWINYHKFHHFGIMKTYSFLYLKILKIGVLKIKFELLEILEMELF